MTPISSYDTAGSFLLLGCTNGSIYYIGTLGVIFTWSQALLQLQLNSDFVFSGIQPYKTRRNTDQQFFSRIRLQIQLGITNINLIQEYGARDARSTWLYQLTRFVLPYLRQYVVCFTDMQKFPLRMKDNDLLVTELYKDPNEDMVTALSVYLTPKTCEWISMRFVLEPCVCK